jgi:hypothetical protein
MFHTLIRSFGLYKIDLEPNLTLDTLMLTMSGLGCLAYHFC